eukprot:TRINITY_DN254_c0_g1_i11.p1 TRINITY_DN254_c0_g1~~TRINITY_DN254_c0_g1_i11.p1  ORF type:complete len:2390 (-),score=794.21 TRINITY_DN254_c0_g1_i11:807-7976(-)
MSAADSEKDFVTKYLATKSHKWRGQYLRVFAMANSGFVNMDPNNWELTNTWTFSGLEAAHVSPDNAKSDDEFMLEINTGKKKPEKYRFASAYKSRILGDLAYYDSQSKDKDFTNYAGEKMGRTGRMVNINFQVFPDRIQLNDDFKLNRRSYSFHDIESISMCGDDANAFIVFVEGKGHMFSIPSRAGFLAELFNAAKQIGVILKRDNDIKLGDFKIQRMKFGTDLGASFMDFEVLKMDSGAGMRGQRRKLSITDKYIVERDFTTYSCVSARKLTEIFALVRYWDDPKKFGVEYTNGQIRRYTAGDRDEALAALLDIALSAGNTVVGVNPRETQRGYRVIPFDAETDDVIENFMLKKLNTQCKLVSKDSPKLNNKATDILLRTCEEFNANIGRRGIHSGIKNSQINKVFEPLVSQLRVLSKGSPSMVTATVLQSLARVAATKQGFVDLLKLPDLIPSLCELLKQQDEGVCEWVAEILRLLCCDQERNRDVIQETRNKRKIINKQMLKLLMELLDRYGGNISSSAHGGHVATTGALVLLRVVSLLESWLCSRADSTPQECYEPALSALAGRYTVLLALFRSKCAGVMESTALLIQSIIERAQAGAARMVQRAALDEGVMLRHLYTALFNPSVEKRFLARYLTSLWCASNADAMSLLKRIFPAGLMQYLSMPVLSDEEMENLEFVELREQEDEGAASPNANANSNKMQQLEHGKASWERLKRRLKDGAHNRTVSKNAKGSVGRLGTKENFIVFFYQITRDHSLPDLIWNAQTRRELREALESEIHTIEREQQLCVGEGAAHTSKRANFDLQKDRIPQWVDADVEADRLAAEKRAKRDIARMAKHAAKATTKKLKKGTKENAVQEIIEEKHVPTSKEDLAEQRFYRDKDSDESDLEEIDETTQDTKSQSGLRIVWNHQEFSVFYKSLECEMKVGDLYIRLFLDGGENALKDMSNPSRLFHALYYRLLRERNSEFRLFSLRAMKRVYDSHYSKIGMFDDIEHLIHLLGETRHMETRDRCLMLIRSLSRNQANSLALLSEANVETLLAVVAQAHTQPMDRRIVNAAYKGVKMLMDAEAGHKSSSELSSGSDVPMWYYLLKKAGSKGKSHGVETGPVTVGELRRLIGAHEIDQSTLIWAEGMPEWLALRKVKQLHWSVLSTGKAILTPAEAANEALQILMRLVDLQPSTDATGAELRPIPRAKRFLCAKHNFAIIAQTLLTGVDFLVDNVCKLTRALVAHNPVALGTLYQSGFFYFGLLYQGSNWLELARLFYDTHMQQNFQTASAALISEQSLGSRSFLGDALPEALVCVLYYRGPDEFAKTFLSNCDTPECIWTFEMRQHLSQMIQQHLGLFLRKLRVCVTLQYDFCPLPPVVYIDLENEMWCHNFYLANLCDEKAFPDWPIRDPISLLSSLLDSWRQEYIREKPDVSTQEAYEIMGLPSDPPPSSSVIRKAYRKLAMKYHPDKNPQGREMFEKIQKAYDILTNARPETLLSGGPDPVNLSLIVKAQIIIYRRYKTDIRPYKYAAYSLLFDTMDFSEQPIYQDAHNHELLLSCGELMHLTCLVSPLNADELTRENGVEKIGLMLIKCVNDFKQLPPEEQVKHGATETTNPDDEEEDDILRNKNKQQETPGKKRRRRVGEKTITPHQKLMQLITSLLRTLVGLTTYDYGRERLFKNSAIIPYLVFCCYFTSNDELMHYVLNIIINCSVEERLQILFINAGVHFRLIPLLFEYDRTLDKTKEKLGRRMSMEKPIISAEALSSLDEMPQNKQDASNYNAKLAAKALSVIAGILPGFKSPVQLPLQKLFDIVFTPAVAKLLRRTNSIVLLETLTGHEETPNIIWYPTMRESLLKFVTKMISAIESGQILDGGIEISSEFEFESIAKELKVADVYVRVYDEQPTFGLDDTKMFGLGLMEYLLKTTTSKPCEIPFQEELRQRHLLEAMRAMHLLIKNHSGLEQNFVSVANVRMMFALARHAEDEFKFSEIETSPIPYLLPVGSQLRCLTLTVLLDFAACHAFVQNAAECNVITTLVNLLLVSKPKPSFKEGNDDELSILKLLSALAVHSEVAGELLREGVLVDLLYMMAGGQHDSDDICNDDDNQAIREQACMLLSRLCTDVLHGTRAFSAVQRMLPGHLAHVVRSEASSAVITFDREHKHPELIWNAEMRMELVASLRQLLKETLENRGEPGHQWDLKEGFHINYRCLNRELNVGGVFIRLFLDDPKYNLRDPRGFVEALLERFGSEASVALSTAERILKNKDASAATNTVTIAEMPVLVHVTHAIVSVLRVRPALHEHLASLGYVEDLSDHMDKATTIQPTGPVSISCMRLIHQLTENPRSADRLGSVKPSPMTVLMRLVNLVQVKAIFTVLWNYPLLLHHSMGFLKKGKSFACYIKY